MAPQISCDPVTCVSHQSSRSFCSRDRVHVRFVESVSGLTRPLLFEVGEASVLGSRERWAVGMGLMGVFGRSVASDRLRDAWAFPWEPCDARGEGMELGRGEGAVMLREEECGWTAGALSSLGREAQHP